MWGHKRSLPRLLALCSLLFMTGAVSAMTVDELVEKNIEARGGRTALAAIKSLKMSGKFVGGGGFEADITTLMARPGNFRTEFSIQGMTGIQAFDGAEAWSIQPFGGRKDPQKLSADQVKVMQVQADLDGPLVDYKVKGHILRYLGTEDVDGTEAHKLQVLLKTGNEQTWYFDPDYFLPIRVQSKTFIRGTETEDETDFGDYEKIDGVFFPMAEDNGTKGSSSDQKSKISYDKIETNLSLDSKLFAFPDTAVRK